MSRKRISMAVALLALIVSSCGGGGEVSETTSPDPGGAETTSTTEDGQETPTETGTETPGSSAEEIGSVDINPCSVLSDSDMADLEVDVTRLGGAAKGFDASNLALFPTCEWGGSTRYELELGPGDLYSGGDESLVGDQSSLGTTVAGDPELQFVSGETWYRLNGEGSGAEQADQERLVDIAGRMIANETGQTGLMDGLASAAVFGGPDVVPCEVVDAQALAVWSGYAAYVVHPSQRVDQQEFVQCTMSFGALDTVSFLISAGSIYDCDDEIDRREMSGVEVCVGTGTAGFGSQAVAGFPDYQVLLVTSREPSDQVVASLFEQIELLLERL